MPRNLGKRLERLLGPHDMHVNTHSLYAQRGDADIHKIPVPMVMNKINHKWQFSERTISDYEGCLRGGRSITVEAKEISGDKLPIGTSGLKPHQLESLLRRHKMGGVVGVIWMPDQDHAYWLSGWFLYNFKKNVYEKPWKYISLESVVKSCPQVMTKDGFVDYLSAALAADKNGEKNHEGKSDVPGAQGGACDGSVSGPGGKVEIR